jgi:hypothetical protein
MSPFSTEVWLYLGVAYLGVSISLFILGRLSPDEWDNPYPCIEEPEVLENQFSLANSLWFTIGALLQQGSELAPKYKNRNSRNRFFNLCSPFFLDQYQQEQWLVLGGSSRSLWCRLTQPIWLLS